MNDSRGALPGRHTPLGATFDGHGVNFALFSEGATGVDLCLFDANGKETRVPLRERTAYTWHAYIPGLSPGQRYGYRVHGLYDPSLGLRFNPAKLLVDPYALEIDGKVDYRAPVFGYVRGSKMDDLEIDSRDSAWGMPKSVVVDTTFDWGDDSRPDVPWSETILYEAHVKGLTKLHPEVPAELRGTYGGVGSAAAIAHLQKLGITTIELLPVHEAVDEIPVTDRGMTNYWGYSTLGFFAPDQRFAARRGGQVREFKSMVKALHAAGVEVVLDVVYNHTGEGDRLGPTLSLRGIDNRTYYRLRHDNPRLHEDYTGCGNSLNMLHPQTLKLVMDSLRYWVTSMHVDGFRFDLASTLARETGAHVDRLSAFFDIIHQDPILSAVKLIAEPWDLGEGGYQVGNFPVLWTEWNGRFRDTVRGFWVGDKEKVGEMGFRLTGSSDLYEDDGRHPHASINFITAHDGFTLHDLVTYEKKKNLANGENNRDGSDYNSSWNCGVEGETRDVAVNRLRARQKRNFLVTLFLSQGVPMLTSGDEMGKTQGGNNNPYVQDNEISWLGWSPGDGTSATTEGSADVRSARRPTPQRGQHLKDGEDLLSFTRELIALRKRHPVFRRHSFFRGAPAGGSTMKDLAWFSPDGREMTLIDWQLPKAAAIGLLLAGDALAWMDETGDPVVDDSFLLLLNAAHEPLTFEIPGAEWGRTWALVLDTRFSELAKDGVFDAGDKVQLDGHTCVLLRRLAPERGSWRPSVHMTAPT